MTLLAFINTEVSKDQLIASLEAHRAADYIAMARAAVEAMMSPPDGIVAAAYEKERSLGITTAHPHARLKYSVAFEAILSAILTEQETTG